MPTIDVYANGITTNITNSLQTLDDKYVSRSELDELFPEKPKKDDKEYPRYRDFQGYTYCSRCNQRLVAPRDPYCSKCGAKLESL